MTDSFNMSGMTGLAQGCEVADSEQYGLQKQSTYGFALLTP